MPDAICIEPDGRGGVCGWDESSVVHDAKLRDQKVTVNKGGDTSRRLIPHPYRPGVQCGECGGDEALAQATREIQPVADERGWNERVTQGYIRDVADNIRARGERHPCPTCNSARYVDA